MDVGHETVAIHFALTVSILEVHSMVFGSSGALDRAEEVLVETLEILEAATVLLLVVESNLEDGLVWMHSQTTGGLVPQQSRLVGSSSRRDSH